jgi:hypothetical protein
VYKDKIFNIKKNLVVSKGRSSRCIMYILIKRTGNRIGRSGQVTILSLRVNVRDAFSIQREKEHVDVIDDDDDRGGGEVGS